MTDHERVMQAIEPLFSTGLNVVVIFGRRGEKPTVLSNAELTQAQNVCRAVANGNFSFPSSNSATQ